MEEFKGAAESGNFLGESGVVTVVEVRQAAEAAQ